MRLSGILKPFSGYFASLFEGSTRFLRAGGSPAAGGGVKGRDRLPGRQRPPQAGTASAPSGVSRSCSAGER